MLREIVSGKKIRKVIEKWNANVQIRRSVELCLQVGNTNNIYTYTNFLPLPLCISKCLIKLAYLVNSLEQTSQT